MSTGVGMVVAFGNHEERAGRVDVERFSQAADEGAERWDASGHDYEGCFDAEEDY